MLAVFVVFAVNRFTFFPSEVAVTAEAAVLATAIVAFRHDSAFVGPWCVALLAGPLDLLHWRQRSFVRMAYNAGNRMLATLAGAASFTILLDSSLLGTGAIRFGAAVLAAVLSYAAVEGAVGVVLVRLHTGASWLGAARIELPLDALSVPLAVVGGAAGYLATEVGWWAATLVLVPTLFVPELALGAAVPACAGGHAARDHDRSRRARRRRARAPGAGAGGIDAGGAGRDRGGGGVRAAGGSSRATARGCARGRGGAREW